MPETPKERLKQRAERADNHVWSRTAEGRVVVLGEKLDAIIEYLLTQETTR